MRVVSLVFGGCWGLGEHRFALGCAAQRAAECGLRHDGTVLAIAQHDFGCGAFGLQRAAPGEHECDGEKAACLRDHEVPFPEISNGDAKKPGVAGATAGLGYSKWAAFWAAPEISEVCRAVRTVGRSARCRPEYIARLSPPDGRSC